MKSPITFFSFALLLAFAGSARAGVVSGRVATAEGAAVAGALVTLSEPETLAAETAYTDEAGEYRIETERTGALAIRARVPGYADLTGTVEVVGDEETQWSADMIRLEDAQARSDQLPASAHAARLQFSGDEHREMFRSQCHFCHQIGNAWTRRARSEEDWQVVFNRMESYGALFTNENEDDFRKTLARDFDGNPIENVQTWDFSQELPKARYREWSVGNAQSYIHDIEVGKDGKLYGVDMGNDKIYVLDPRTGESADVDFPPSDLPMGGMFSGGIAPLGTHNAKHGPHSIQEGPDGKMWVTASLGGEIASYDPASGEWEVFPIGEDAIYPHTLRWDEQGILWFTIALSNQVGRFDPKTKEFKLIQLPTHGFWRWMSDATLPGLLRLAAKFPKEDLHIQLSPHRWNGQGKNMMELPYGIDVHPSDGSIWYSKLYASYIGRIDPQTLEIKEYEPPLKGPRRLRFSKDGILWIPSFEESALMKFDPATEEWETFALPTLAPGEYEIPYALSIHPDTGDVWITSNLSDRLFRFIRGENRFVSYPSPTRVTYMRDLVFLKNGGVCSSNSNLPAAAIEGGLPKMMCVYPDAGVLSPPPPGAQSQ